MKLDDILGLLTSRSAQEKQRFEGSLKWYLPLNRFVFHSAELVKEQETISVEVVVGTPLGQTKTLRVPVASESTAFSADSADSIASAIIKSEGAPIDEVV